MAKPHRFRDGWRIRPFNAFGERISEVHADYDDALFAIRRIELEREEVRRGLRAPSLPNKTFNELCDYWLAKRAPQKRSAIHDESVIRRHLRPAFGKLPLRTITTAHIDDFIGERSNLSKKTISNHLTLLITMLNTAVELRWLAEKPRIKKPKVPMFSKDYSFLRTHDEVRRFLAAARDEGELAYAFFATAVYTGMRAGELAALRWDDIKQFSKPPLVTVQRSFDGPTKSDQVRYVPVLEGLQPILRAWKLRSANSLVFPNQSGRMHCRSARIFKQIFHRVLEAAGFSPRIINGKVRPYIVFHDLRHTFASHFMMASGDLFRLQGILGHKSAQMTMRYAHLSPKVYTDDLERLNGFILPDADVIRLPLQSLPTS